MKSYKSLLLALCLLFLTACPMDYAVLLIIENRSNQELLVYLGRGSGGTLYPDTLLPPTEVGSYVRSNYTQRLSLSGRGNFEAVYSEKGVDTLSFFFLSRNTITKYGWSNVYANYRILVRYDLSLSDINHLKSRLSYPPSTDMRYMKMYPPYEDVLRKEE
jgi:hypothetical protein